MREYVYMPEEEKRETLRFLGETVKEYPIVAHVKDETELRWMLGHGYIDFVADVPYWTGATRRKKGIVRRIMPWEQATIGYHIRAMNISDCATTVNYLVDQNRDHTFIYFRVHSPEIPFPRKSHVDEAMRERDAWMRELSTPGDYVRREFYDY